MCVALYQYCFLVKSLVSYQFSQPKMSAQLLTMERITPEHGTIVDKSDLIHLWFLSQKKELGFLGVILSKFNVI